MKSSLLEDAKLLSVDERMELAEAIWETIPEDAGPSTISVSDEHRAELDRRLADLESSPEASSPWQEVRDRLEKA